MSSFLTTCALLGSAIALPQDPPTFDPESLQKKIDEIVPRVAELRGWEFKREVPGGVQNVDQFVEFAQREFESDFGTEKFQAMQESFRLFAFIEPEADLYDTFLELLKDQVGGYYDPSQKKFYMIDTYNQGALADILMAHELTHALDDQYYDLKEMLDNAPDNSDGEFAIGAVVEGSATSVMMLYTFQGTMKGWLNVEELQESIEGMTEEQIKGLEKAPPYLIMTMALPYIAGNRFLVRDGTDPMAIMKTPKDEDLHRAYRTPPSSSEQILHPEKYWEEEQFDPPTALILPDLSAAMGEGWKLLDSNVLGELGTYVVTTDPEELPDLMTAEGQMGIWTNTAAAGWDGDRYQTYTGPNGEKLMAWVSVWDSKQDHREFASALQETTFHYNGFLREIGSEGDAVVAWFSNKAGRESLPKLKKALFAARPDWQ